MANELHRLFSSSVLGLRLFEFRNAKGLHQRDLAKYVGVCPRIIYDYESGQKYPQLDRLCLIASVLDVTVDDLLS